VLHGAGTHRLDGHWGRRKTFFDSELYKFLAAWIDSAISHHDAPLRSDVDVDVEAMCRKAGLTEREWEALAITIEGNSLRECAAYLEIAHQTVARRLGRARAKLQSGGLLQVGVTECK